jgi:hypothetical protein
VPDHNGQGYLFATFFRQLTVAKLFAGRLSLIAFATVSLRGVMTSGQFDGTLRTALAAAAAFYVIGLMCGDLARRLVEEDARIEVNRMIAEEQR